MIEIDCRNLMCPEPVLRTKKALEENPNGALRVLVDSAAPRDNILRFAQSLKLAVSWKEENSGLAIEITRAESLPTGAEKKEEEAIPQPAPSQQVILIGSDQLGRGSNELGALLMRNFIYTLTKQDRLPRTIIFINGGVRLCTETSAVIDDLKLLSSAGVTILACGTCLDYYELKESLLIGTVSNMYEITEQLNSSAVITL